MNYKHVLAIVGSLIVMIGIVFALNTAKQVDSPREKDHNITSTSSSPEEIKITDGVKHTVPLDEIKSGGPPKDGIPPIDNPKFVKTDDAVVGNDELVIGLEFNGETKAYPLSILVWHEIVNDRLGNTPVAVTYCPLCFTTQVFDRTINNKETEFGTSGKLYNSNLVMYDRNTDSMWSQALGKSIIGELTGYELKKIPFDLARWSDWKKLHPDTLVLTTDTGFSRPYGSDPYGDYYTNSQIFFPVKNSDNRMYPKEIILGFDNNNTFKAYTLADVESQKVINDNLGDKKLVLVAITPFTVHAFERTVDGQTLEFVLGKDGIIDKQTNSEWNYDGLAISGQLKGKHLDRISFNPGFWFEWVAFHPNTEVYQIT